jgi:ADP-heptose:LPS heptosyltransferase
MVVHLAGRLCSRGGSEPFEPNRLLFLQYETALGAAVNATPVFEAVKAAAPEAFIAVASAGRPYEVLRHNPFIDHLVRTPSAHDGLASAAWHIVRACRRMERFDGCVSDSGNMKTRIALLAILSKAHRRIGFTVAPDLFHRPLHREPRLSIRDDNLRLTEALGLGCHAAEPRVFFSWREVEAVERLLVRSGLQNRMPVVVFVTQTSGGQPTEWYGERFATVAKRLTLRHGAAIVFVGTASQSEGIERIRRQLTQDSVSFAGETDVPTLSALMCRADLVVTLDTGPMHLARAAGVPTVVIAPAWQPAFEWLPLDVATCLVLRRDDIACAECRKFFCSTRACMDQIGADEVIHATEKLWADHPPSPSNRQRRIERSLVHSVDRSAEDQKS